MSNREIIKATIDTPLRYQCVEHVSEHGAWAHYHNFLEIELFVENGSLHTLNGKEYVTERGTLVVVSDVDQHEYRLPPSIPYYRAFSTHFYNDLLSPSVMRLFEKLTGHQYTCRTEEQFALLRYEFQLLHDVINGALPTSDSKAMVKNTLSRILLLADSFFGGETLSQDTVKSDDPEIDYVNRYFRHPVTLEEVAEAVGLSPYYFSRKFHAKHGVTFQEYLLKKRLQWAYDLIQSSPLPVSQIAEEAGFNSRSYFVGKFKQYYGCSPRELRKNEAKP